MRERKKERERERERERKRERERERGFKNHFFIVTIFLTIEFKCGTVS